jgi:Zn-dependent protease
MVSTLFASARSLIAPLLALAGWWLCFHAPLGRRKFRASLVIPAPASAVWRILDPRSHPSAWNPVSDVRGRRIIGEAPLTVEFESRPRESGGDFQKVVTTFPVVEPGRRLVQCVRSRAGRAIPEERLHFETIELVDGPRGARTTLSVVTPVRGLIAYELTRVGVARALEAIRRAALGQSAERAPWIRFTGWRLLAAATATAFALLAGYPLAWSGKWIGFAAALAIPLTLTLAVLAHELGHALAFLAFGHRGVTVSLVPFVGGATWSRRRYANGFESGFVALAGAAFSALVCLPLLPALGAVDALLTASLHDPAALVARGAWLAKFQLFAAVIGVPLIAWQTALNAINLLPLPGLDGARALEAIVTDRRLRLAGAGCCLAIFTLLTGSARATLEIALFAALLRLPSIFRRAPAPLAPPTSPQRLVLIAMFALSLVADAQQRQREHGD